jgi:hypothetical protein
MTLLRFLDIFFLVFHLILVVFNLFGWIYKPTRRLNLITLSLTFLAWFGLGIFYGIGYCPLTDWHWQVLMKLGVSDLPNSYITYLLERVFHLSVEERLIDIFTVVLFFTALVVSIIANLKMKKKAD